MAGAERRRDSRMAMGIPVRVEGYDPDGSPWQEMTSTDDASQGGASFTLRHPHQVGQVLLLALPLPHRFRSYDLAETSFRTYALVRTIRTGEGETRHAGVMFLGRNPPAGFEQRPGGLYRLPEDGREETPRRVERRAHERLGVCVNLRIRRTAGAPAEEQTVTENLGRGGIQVPTTLPIASGETLVVSDLDGRASATAVVRNVHTGRDRIARLNLQFPDPASFEQLLAAAGAPLPAPART